MTKENKTLVLVALACLVGGHFIASAQPHRKTPAQRRPVLAFIVRAAKSLLWLAAFADPPPDVQQTRGGPHTHHVDDNGFVMVDHGQGW